MKINKPAVPKAQEEVWDWKSAIYQDHKHLPLPEALREILRQAGQAAERLNLNGISSILSITIKSPGTTR